MSIAYYPAIIERGAGGFGAFFPDLAGCTSAGSTLQEAARNAEEALQAHFELSAERGDAPSLPSELGVSAPDPAIAETARVLVRVELLTRTVRERMRQDRTG